MWEVFMSSVPVFHLEITVHRVGVEWGFGTSAVEESSPGGCAMWAGRLTVEMVWEAVFN